MENLKKLLENPGAEYRCDVRWWLAEGLHTDRTLKKEIRALSEDGFGAAEFLAIDELGADSARYGWGSEEWVHDTETIIGETTRRGLGASLTSGTNWSNANLPDFVHGPDDRSASKELDFTVEEVASGASRSGPLAKSILTRAGVTVQELVAVVAARRDGERDGKPLLHPDTLVLTDRVRQEALDWTAPDDGDYLLFAFWLHGTGQTASPSVSVSYTVNYIDRYGIDKLTAYWDEEVLTPQLRKYIKENGRVQMYMDSLELATYGKGGQFWGYHLNEEFRRRRGYDIAPHLPFLLRVVRGMAFGPYEYHYEMADGARAAKIRCDLYQTMTDLYIANMLEPMQKWLHSVGMTLRAEISYGLPFEISQPGKYVDGIETESLEFASQIDSYRGLAGVAHLYDKVYSSETGATMMNYMMGLDFYTQIIYTQFAAGITKTVLHGYSSIAGSEESTQWPGHEGMWPIFSERFGERQPAYRHYRDWTAMIARFQKLLRSGKPRRDVAILRLDYNFWNTLCFGADEKERYEHQLMRANEGIYWRDPALQNAGYAYDYFAPQLLEDPDVAFADGVIQPDGPGYQAVILYQEALPLASARALLKRAEMGLPVILANGLTETVQQGREATHKAPGLYTPFLDGGDGELAQVMAALRDLPNVREIDDPALAPAVLKELGVTPRAGFAEPSGSMLTLARQDGAWRYVFAYHYLYAGGKPAEVTLRLEGLGVPYRVDCWTGGVEPAADCAAEGAYTLVKLRLKPGEAAVIALDTATRPGEVAVPGRDYREDIALDRWSLTVESWDAGEKRVIEEDRGLGYVTKEVYYETVKTSINAGETALIPWRDIPAVGPAVSGVGTYTTTVTLPESWCADDGAVLCIGSTGGNSAAVYVNGVKGPALDFDRLEVDLSALLKPGENTLVVEVSSTLANRLQANGYYRKVKEISNLLQKTAMGHDSEEGDGGLLSAVSLDFPPQAYGMTGEVKLRAYRKILQ